MTSVVRMIKQINIGRRNYRFTECFLEHVHTSWDLDTAYSIVTRSVLLLTLSHCFRNPECQELAFIL